MPAKYKYAPPGSGGHALLQARTKLQMTQVEFSAKVGINPTQYARYERGERILTLDRMREVSGRLGMDLFAGITATTKNGPPEGGPSMEARRALLEAAKQVRALSDALYDQATQFTPMTVPASVEGVREAIRARPAKKAGHR